MPARPARGWSPSPLPTGACHGDVGAGVGEAGVGVGVVGPGVGLGPLVVVGGFVVGVAGGGCVELVGGEDGCVRAGVVVAVTAGALPVGEGGSGRTSRYVTNVI